MAFVHGDLSFMGDISMWQPYLREFDKVAYVSDGVKHGFIKAFPELAENAVTLYNFFNEEEIYFFVKFSAPSWMNSRNFAGSGL